MRFLAIFLVAMAVLGLSGCGELSRRTITDQEMVLTPETIESLAGDYRVMLDGRIFHPPSDTYFFISDLETAGLRPGMMPATVSVRFAKDAVWLTLKCQGQESIQVCRYSIVDNEMQLEVQNDDIDLFIIMGSMDNAAGFGRLKDGRLWMRCRSSGFFLMLFLIPFFPDNETTVLFTPIVLPDEPQVSD